MRSAPPAVGSQPDTPSPGDGGVLPRAAGSQVSSTTVVVLLSALAILDGVVYIWGSGPSSSGRSSPGV